MASSADPLADAGATVIVLAAQRGGRLDPLADKAGVSHKCLVEISGRPLIAHVLAALAQVEGVGQVNISVEPEVVPELKGLGNFGLSIDYVPAARNIADSGFAAAHRVEGPMIVTTADNVLLTPAAVGQMIAKLAEGAEVVVALTTREAVLAAHPQGQRRFYRFADASYSNCNLYGLHGAKAVQLAEAFRSGGQFVKNPKRLAMAVGIFNLLLFRLALYSLPAAMRRLSKRFGVRIEALVLADGSHAIDVDNDRTYAIARTLLDKRLFQSH